MAEGASIQVFFSPFRAKVDRRALATADTCRDPRVRRQVLLGAERRIADNGPHPAFVKPTYPSRTMLRILTVIALATACCSDLLGGEVPLAAQIDRILAADHAKAHLQDSGLSSDATFLRRIYLDLIGRIPTSEEAERYWQQPSDTRRRLLVDRLLAHPHHARHWAEQLDAILMGRAGAGRMAERRQHGWLEYLQTAIADNRPWDRMAREMILARSGPETDVRAGWFLYERANEHQQIAEAVAPALLGIRVECAQCHDHPLASEIQQQHYWGLVAFFRRSRNVDTPEGPRVAESAVGGFGKFIDLAGDSYDTQLTFFESPTIADPVSPEQQDAPELYRPQAAAHEPPVPLFSRREQFANEVLLSHPLLARAFVNRTWAMLFGRGIVHPYDRMDSMHDPSHAELLDILSSDFRQHGYDIRRLIRGLVLSRSYQLAAPHDADAHHRDDFIYALQRPISAEAYLRSIYVVLTGEATEPPADQMDSFRRVFPEILPETPRWKVDQAMFLTNHAGFQQTLYSDAFLNHGERSASRDEQIERLFRLALSRPADQVERQAAIDYLSTRSAQLVQRESASGSTLPPNGNAQQAGLAGLVWAIITGPEFASNH